MINLTLKTRRVFISVDIHPTNQPMKPTHHPHPFNYYLSGSSYFPENVSFRWVIWFHPYKPFDALWFLLCFSVGWSRYHFLVHQPAWSPSASMNSISQHELHQPAWTPSARVKSIEETKHPPTLSLRPSMSHWQLNRHPLSSYLLSGSDRREQRTSWSRHAKHHPKTIFLKWEKSK